MNRKYWSAPRIFAACVGGGWLGALVGFPVAILDGGYSRHTLMPALISSGFLLLGLTMVALVWWGRTYPPNAAFVRRPALVGGRVMGEGLPPLSATPSAAARAPRPRPREQVEVGTVTMWQPAVPAVAVGVATVAVAEPEAAPTAEELQTEVAEFSEREFRAWADGKREGRAEGKAEALDELGLADDEGSPGQS